MTEKLTKRLIDGFEYTPNGGKDIRWDSEISGLGLRLYPSGKKSFVLSYRQRGTKRLFTIGQYGNITLEQARELARKKFGEIADGKDPLLSRRESKKKHQWTVERAFKEFQKKLKALSRHHYEEVERIFTKDVLPVIGKKPIDEVKKDDILKIIDGVMERGSGVMANRTLTRLGKFFNWCIERNLIEHSPVYKISKPAIERSRERVLADYEIKQIWRAADKVGYPFGPLVQFLILTGQRRGEVAAMQWKDYHEKEALWIQPREETKSDRSHTVPLSPSAVEILDNALNLGGYIFTSSGTRPFENFSRAKAELDLIIKSSFEKENPSHKFIMAPWTLHDLRRTCASGMAKLKIAPHVIEKILNHSSGTIRGVAAIYNRYEYEDEKRYALNKWAEHIQYILNNSNVLPVSKLAKKASKS
ncbi:MAG: tyrosine-type recombinase/integrase [Alphaproteobacteria bacterium]|nr:tyrosine-type recombinase/integrase [Alphaproteobacteria bacterium]